jgi:hypothetical protein
MNKESKRTIHRLTVPFEYNKKLIELSGDGRVYRDCTMLTPGAWSDSVSMTEIHYTEDALIEMANKYQNDVYMMDREDKVPLNLDHIHKVLNSVGYAYKINYNDGVKGDLYLHRLTADSRDIVRLIDNGYINALSVEITTNDEWDPKDNKVYAKDINLIGLAIVESPACRDAKIQ